MDAQECGFGHPECYARALGGCCREMSGEHYISESVLELIYGRAGEVSRSVLVRGLAFQKPNELKGIGVASLVGKVLCKTHNSQLSPFDVVGKEMFAGMDGLNDATGDPSSPEKVMRVDGDGLERWMLKSLCGGLCSGAFRVSPTETLKGVCPLLNWLQILFTGAKFPTGQGMYYMPGQPEELVTADQYVLRVGPLVSLDEQVVLGLQTWFFGFKFALLMANLMPGVSTMFDNAMYRPAGLRAIGSNTQIQLDWQAGSASDEVVVMHVRE